MNFLFTSFFFVHKLSAWLFLGAAMRFFGLWYYLLGLLLLFVQGRAPLKGFVYGRHTRKIPLSQGFSSFKTVHRTVLKFTFFGAPFGLGDFALCGARRLGLLAPLDPLGKAGNSALLISTRLATAFFFDKRLSFVRERNKQGSWRSQLLGNSAKPTFHASLHPALFNF